MAPEAGRRWATRPRRWAVRVQPQAVPAVHGLGEVVHGRPGHCGTPLKEILEKLFFGFWLKASTGAACGPILACFRVIKNDHGRAQY